jgi:hypothetical protein
MCLDDICGDWAFSCASAIDSGPRSEKTEKRGFVLTAKIFQPKDIDIEKLIRSHPFALVICGRGG